ncbi:MULTISPECIES: LLM class flavin-dependent oxidoreductase [Microbacterium]|uniref:LLM class flavin-dependent oxidoreductase n=1 Tax=Microbacterium TaxID=33882 RepID=UPI00278209B8|nr:MULTISPECIES: LLM class flavin-dependent oxidoreductase [Microbacterium]MDQ1085103.1 alkanesulfonate monooxygenase SsuD/methylene tetrahydromethanopterin reductase-like flavin-dependent oxidoreductase (luciferase family) [Microbacterium sp. SORGH_AS_0344]MDQ1169620.1 alkanesulfonate monooxygenase SsuD/methylene tetrahydromethanopterin reductase-like flavin-dependent oxidoreductase (luciferase family) [Microbacterium proteolyticum]
MTAVAPTTTGAAPRTLTLGFHTRVPFTTGEARRGLDDGVALFRHAEQGGYDRGWVYQRHFDNYLAAPLVFLPVVAQYTSRIGLGTAIIGMRYQDPVLLAEAASTADHLSGGRLQLGLGTGMGGFDRAFRQEPNDGRAVSLDRLDVFLRAIRGEAVGHGANGEPLTVRGASRDLIERVWFGAGSVASAERVAGRGLHLMLSTILTGAVADYDAEQRAAIAAFREGHPRGSSARVSVSRSILPATSVERARRYAAYDAERRARGPAASRPQGAVAPAPQPPGVFTMSPAIHGEPESVVDALLADPAVAEADDVIAFLPPEFALDESRRLLDDIAEHVAPALRIARGASA